MDDAVNNAHVLSWDGALSEIHSRRQAALHSIPRGVYRRALRLARRCRRLSVVAPDEVSWHDDAIILRWYTLRPGAGAAVGRCFAVASVYATSVTWTRVTDDPPAPPQSWRRVAGFSDSRGVDHVRWTCAHGEDEAAALVVACARWTATGRPLR